MNQAMQFRQDDEKTEGPKHLQIRRHLIEQMQAGTYNTSRPLPSESDQGVAVNLTLSVTWLVIFLSISIAKIRNSCPSIIGCEIF